MKAILVTCPYCGARLQIQSAAVVAVCEHCGTSSRLQRRTRILERVIPAPDAPNLPAPVAVQRRTLAPPILFGIGAIAVSGAVTVISVQGRSMHAPTPPASGLPMTSATPARVDAPTRPPNPSWQAGGLPLLADIDADGTVEILGRGRRGDDVVLLAIDQGGALRWTSEPLGTYDATYTAPLALGNDALLFGGPRGDVRAFALADGTQRWTTRLDERTQRFCDAGSIVIAIGADDVRRGLQVADGASAPLPAERAPACAPLPMDTQPHAPNSATRALAQQHGISGFEHTIHDLGGRGRLIAGKRSTGTAVATLVVLDERGAERWRADVPVDPLGATPEAPTEVAIGADVVCATYHPQSSTDALDLTCFGLAAGTRRWTQRLSSHYVSALVPIDGTLLISMWGHLEARDLLTGAVRWQYTER